MTAAASALIPFVSRPIQRGYRSALVTPEGELQAETRYRIIEPLLEYKLSSTRFKSLRLADGRPVSSYTRMVEYTAQISGFSRRTLFDWVDRYERFGRPGLADQQRSDNHTSRFFTRYQKAQWLAAYLYLECHASKRVCWEFVVRLREVLEIPDEDVPSYETVRAWLESMPPALTTYARLGRKAYHDRMTPFLRRDLTDIYANQTLVGDSMIHDVVGQNDCYEEAEYGEPIRIRLTALLCLRSRLPVGRTWCWEGSSRSIAAALLRATLTYGPGEEAYFDNGHDFDKIAKNAIPTYMQESPLAPANWWREETEEVAKSGVLRRLGMTITNCIPYHPQSKPIERFFRTLHERFDMLWPTWTAGKMHLRPDGTTVAWEEHKRLMRAGRLDESKLPRVSRIIAECDAWMEEYSDTEHRGEGMEGATPRQIFDAYRSPRQRPAPDPAELVLLMAEREERLVRECSVTVDKRRYLPVDEAGWATMHDFNDRDVLVAHDKGAYEHAAALDQNGNFLAWLAAETLVRHAPGDPATKQRVAESLARGRRLEKRTRDTITLISRGARQLGVVSPLEAMQQRHQIPADSSVAELTTQRRKRLEPPKTDEPQSKLLPGEQAQRLAARLLRREQ